MIQNSYFKRNGRDILGLPFTPNKVVNALDIVMNVCEQLELSPAEVRVLGEMLTSIAR